MKFESNWRFKSLDALEKVNSRKPEYDSHLVVTCTRLRKIPLNKFGVEDLRIMIGQNISLKYLIPLAIEVLEKDILAEGDLYEGDLLNAVLSSEVAYWKTEKQHWETILLLFEKNRELLDSFNVSNELRKEMRLFDEFTKIHN